MTGHATFIDDIESGGTLHLAMVRSPFAHAEIKGVDASAALDLPGVHAVLTGAELVRHAKVQPVGWEHIDNQRAAPTYAMAVGKVRYCGQIVAAVAAESRALAEDAAELVEVDYEPLPVVHSIEDALAPDAPRLVPEWPDNVFGSQTYGNGDADAAFADAEVTVSERLTFGRQFGCPLEPRGAVATWERYTNRIELWINSQSPNRVREVVAEVLGVPVSGVRVRVPGIGGGFGSKANYYGEEILCCLLSRLTGRPVKYIEDRQESFVATSHAREQRIDVAVAATRDGVITALRGHIVGVLGGEISSVGMGPVWLSAVSIPGPYRIPNLELSVTGVLTNRTPYGSYRGWGAPKATFAMERIIERLARELGVDSNEIRRRNFVRPEEMPYSNGVFATLDSGRYEHCLDLCVERLRRDGWYRFREEARAAGRKVGIGVAAFVESTGIGPSRVMARLGIAQGGYDEAVVRMDSTGRVTVFTGQTEMGQGMSTTLAQLCADELNIPVDQITVVMGDTDACPYTGYGTGGSRAAAVGGVAVRQATGELKRQILRVASHQLEVDVADLEIADGLVQVRGLPGYGRTLADVAYAAYRRLTDVGEGTTPTLQGRAVFDPVALTYANGCAGVVVEVDPATGGVTVLGYVMVDDCGTMINPQIVDGQLHGGCAQAIGGALLEDLVYDRNGQLLTTTFMDYLLPTAMEVPPFSTVHVETPAPNTPGGMKGVGEAGTVPGPAAIAAAIDDAVDDPAVFVRHLPVSPEQVYRFCNAAG
ncbi:aldehyde dehydrogenase [Streptosporangium violaceochromogenes]|nr:aldehyde dehydrogenase [Streptosporangium violaceochromogenes]